MRKAHTFFSSSTDMGEWIVAVAWILSLLASTSRPSPPTPLPPPPSSSLPPVISSGILLHGFSCSNKYQYQQFGHIETEWWGESNGKRTSKKTLFFCYAVICNRCFCFCYCYCRCWDCYCYRYCYCWCYTYRCFNFKRSVHAFFYFVVMIRTILPCFAVPFVLRSVGWSVGLADAFYASCCATWIIYIYTTYSQTHTLCCVF